MGQASVNKRRHRQAANGFAHLSPRQRPSYKKRDIVASQRHEARLRATENRIRQGKKK